MTTRILITWAPLAAAVTLIPGAGLAQTAPLSSSPAGVSFTAQCPCPIAPPIGRALLAPPREIGVKIAALLPLTGPSFSYARNINDSIAVEAACASRCSSSGAPMLRVTLGAFIGIGD